MKSPNAAAIPIEGDPPADQEPLCVGEVPLPRRFLPEGRVMVRGLRAAVVVLLGAEILGLPSCVGHQEPASVAPTLPEAPNVAAPVTYPLGEGSGTVSLLLDLDAVAQAVPWDGKVIQRTPSGALVLRDQRTFSIEQVLLEPTPARVLGVADSLYAGFADGRLARIGADLQPAEVGRLSTAPLWIGAAQGELTAVVLGAMDAQHMAPVEVWSPRGELHTTLDASNVFGGTAPTAAVVAGDTLFVGWDWGEWGGAVAQIPLHGAPPTIETSGGIYGLATLPDGVWAFGGVMHMGMLASSLYRLEPPDGPVYHTTSFDREGPTQRPDLPITHLLDGPGPDERTVLSYDDVFRVDPALGRWTRVGTFDLRYRGGRPDAVGA